MGAMDKLWDAVSNVVKMNDKVERVAATVGSQQGKIEDLTARRQIEFYLSTGFAVNPLLGASPAG
jgi:hypothetical protein